MAKTLRSVSLETVKVKCPSGGWMLVNKANADDYELYAEPKKSGSKPPPKDGEKGDDGKGEKETTPKK